MFFLSLAQARDTEGKIISIICIYNFMWFSTGLSVPGRVLMPQVLAGVPQFVGNITDLVTWVHIKGGNTFSNAASTPKPSHHRGGIFGCGPSLCRPCLL